MKKPIVILAAASALGVPAAGSAQVFEGVFLGFGLAGHHYPEYEYGLGLGLARVPLGDPYHSRRGFSLGVGVGFGVGFALSYDSHGHGAGGHLYDYYGFGARDLHYCHDYWHGYYCECAYHAGWAHGWGWHDHWYRPATVVFGWPRFHFDRYSFGPYWRDPYHDWWGYRGWDPYWGYQRYRTTYVDYDRGYGRTRVATRSPLFGPRYKEDPRPAVLVTDNGPERPVSRAVPRGDRTDRLAGIASSRPSTRRGDQGARAETTTRTAQPRVRARPEVAQDRSAGRASPREPVKTSRPAARIRTTPTRGSVPTTRSAPVRSTRPVTRSSPAVRSAPTTRSAPPRVRSAPTTRSAPPKVRSAPTTRSAPPRVRSAPTTRSAPPQVRSAPPRARSAPVRTTPPKARSAPPRRSPPKSAPPRRRGN